MKRKVYFSPNISMNFCRLLLWVQVNDAQFFIKSFQSLQFCKYLNSEAEINPEPIIQLPLEDCDSDETPPLPDSPTYQKETLSKFIESSLNVEDIVPLNGHGHFEINTSPLPS